MEFKKRVSRVESWLPQMTRSKKSCWTVFKRERKKHLSRSFDKCATTSASSNWIPVFLLLLFCPGIFRFSIFNRKWAYPDRTFYLIFGAAIKKYGQIIEEKYYAESSGNNHKLTIMCKLNSFPWLSTMLVYGTFLKMIKTFFL